MRLHACGLHLGVLHVADATRHHFVGAQAVISFPSNVPSRDCVLGEAMHDTCAIADPRSTILDTRNWVGRAGQPGDQLQRTSGKRTVFSQAFEALAACLPSGASQPHNASRIQSQRLQQ